MKPQDQHSQDREPPDPVLPEAAASDVLPVAVEDEFEVFGLWMNVQLSQLVARWKHLAAPRAAKADRIDFGRRSALPRKAK